MATVIITHIPGSYHFEASDEAGLSIHMDSTAAHGGQELGVSPMQSMLMALGGCSGIDVVSILTKQRQPLSELEIRVSGEREADEVPALWKQAHVQFLMPGADLAKAEHAVRLSIEKYCSVAETLRRAGCVITWEVLVD
jgi:putative redox protein